MIQTIFEFMLKFILGIIFLICLILSLIGLVLLSPIILSILFVVYIFNLDKI